MDVLGVDFSSVNITDISADAAGQLAGSGVRAAAIGYDTTPASTNVRRAMQSAGVSFFGAYRFLYTWLDPAAQVQNCIQAIHMIGSIAEFPAYFVLDVEDYPLGSGPSITQVEAAMDAVEAAGITKDGLVKPVVYTRQGYWNEFYGNYSGPADRGWGLWGAFWQRSPNIDGMPLYGGWRRDQVVGQQYTGTVGSAIGGVDMNIFRIPDAPGPDPDPGPGPDPDPIPVPGDLEARVAALEARTARLNSVLTGRFNAVANALTQQWPEEGGPV